MSSTGDRIDRIQTPAAGPGTSAGADEGRTGTGLKTRHLTMMGLGSAIGAGLFLGTGAGITAAGPAVLLSYTAAGIVVILVMRMLGEMAAAYPASGSFSDYAARAFGPVAGFTLGWLYWFMLVMVMGAELTGAAAIISTWLGGIDPWIPALVCMVFFTVVNLSPVRNFGEFEFWFALIKVAVIVGFLILGALLAFGLLPNTEPVGLTNLTGHGFLPYGWSGVAAGLLVVAFAFGGIEIVTIAAAESEDPATAIRSAVRSVVWRIAVFYLGSVLVITALLPWQTLAGTDSAEVSPFTQVLQLANLRGVTGFMELIIVVALLSAFNAQIYGTSRMLYALSRQRNAPRVFAVTDRNLVPRNALLLSIFFGFVIVVLTYLEINGLLTFLLNAVGAVLLLLWFVIAASELKLRRQIEAEGRLLVPMWAYPALPIATIVMLAALTLLMAQDDAARNNLLAMLVVTAVVVLAGSVNYVLRRRAGAIRPGGSPGSPGAA